MEVLYFSAPWCDPCKVFRPLLLSVVKDYPEVSLKQLNVDAELQKAYDNNISTIPTLVSDKMRLSGAAKEEVLREWLDIVTKRKRTLS